MAAESEGTPQDVAAFTIADDQAGERIDRFVVRSLRHMSRSAIQRLVEGGYVTLNREPVKAGAKLKSGDRVEIVLPFPGPSPLTATPMPLAIVYEDEDLLVLDKPAGLVVHPAPGHSVDTLVNALLARYPDIHVGDTFRPGIVHRLDKDTSGLMVVAKNDRAMASLTSQMKERQPLKEYTALVEGMLETPRGVVDAPLGRDPRERKRMAVVTSGRPARTYFEVMEELRGHSLLRVRLETGRTHQIRVHMASLGHAVEGDKVYGRGRGCLGLDRQFLHSSKLSFRLPYKDEVVEFRSELPQDLSSCLAELRLRGGT